MYHLSALMTKNCRYFQLYKQLNILSLENHHNVEKVCPKCKTPIGENDLFCSNCGEAL